MGVIQVSDDLKRVIERQVIARRAASEAEFLYEAVRRYADALDTDDDVIAAASDEGIADMRAGRFEMISSPADVERLQAELSDRLDHLASEHQPSNG